jgi:predicted PurR-regulated permease PerM
MEVPLQKTNNYLLLAILVTVVLYFGQPVLIPLAFGALFAMLMAPLCRYLDKKTNRGLSSFICMMIVMVAILIILGVAAWQVASFVEDMPAIKERTEKFITSAQQFIQETFGVSPEKQKSFMQKQMSTAGESAGAYAGQLLGSISSATGWLVLSLIFTFLFLYNKERYESFFVKIFKNDEPAHVKSIVKKISQVSEQYLLGRTYSILIMFVLYSTGLLIIGIKNALLLAAIASLLTFIPYVGTIFGSIFPVIMALITEDSTTPAIWTAVVMVSIQALDNYFIEPYVVGGEVNLSAFATIFIIVCGGLVWGIPGTILFIPLLAIIKIICDNVESLKPYGYLIGDPDGSKPSKLKMWIQEKFQKAKKTNGKAKS